MTNNEDTNRERFHLLHVIGSTLVLTASVDFSDPVEFVMGLDALSKYGLIVLTMVMADGVGLLIRKCVEPFKDLIVAKARMQSSSTLTPASSQPAPKLNGAGPSQTSVGAHKNVLDTNHEARH